MELYTVAASRLSTWRSISQCTMLCESFKIIVWFMFERKFKILQRKGSCMLNAKALCLCMVHIVTNNHDVCPPT